jgi:hypothetical protein
MDNEVYSTFAAKHPACSRLVSNLVGIEGAISAGCFTSFFEPVAIVGNSVPKNAQELRGQLVPHLESWSCHIAYGTITRLRGLSRVFMQQLLEDQLSIASVLQRAIIEHAGRAAYAVCRVTECRSNDKWDEMRTLIPKSLFGAAMTDIGGSVLEDFAELLAQRSVRPSDFVEALEKFAGTRDSSGKSFFKGLYALLCDLTHGSQRANQPFCRVLESSDEGWSLEYAWDEHPSAEAVEGTLRTTARCLQAGYAASAMLLAWSFRESADRVVGTAPGPVELRWIWQNILDPELVFGDTAR